VETVWMPEVTMASWRRIQRRNKGLAPPTNCVSSQVGCAPQLPFCLRQTWAHATHPGEIAGQLSPFSIATASAGPPPGEPGFMGWASRSQVRILHGASACLCMKSA